ncbi:conserved hypothetical protein [Rhodospirillaceae bacterium LM-1]|nr:conserved hypothetical protein [Rhodospirillaceae bacterium LM-1]
MDTSAVFGAFTIAGVCITLAIQAYRLVRDLGRAIRARSWPRTKGRLDTAQVVESSVNGGKFYSVAVSYRFTANGQDWTGKNILFGSLLPMTLEKAEEKMRALLATPEPEVVYHPQKPNICALEAKAGVFVPATWVIMVSVTAAGVAYLLAHAPAE